MKGLPKSLSRSSYLDKRLEAAGGGPAQQTVRFAIHQSEQAELLAADVGNAVFFYGDCGGIIHLSAAQSALIPQGGLIECVFIWPTLTFASIIIDGGANIYGPVGSGVRANSTFWLRKLMTPADELGIEVWSLAGGASELPPLSVSDIGKVAKVVDRGDGVPIVTWATDAIS